jgi:hypothetical protein
MLKGVDHPEITAMVRHHHERLDGHGYPDRLAGTAIPLGARIIAVADTFDALTSSRAYRRAATQKKAIEILNEGAGSQLDEHAVGAFLGSCSARRSVLWSAVAVEAPWSLLSGLQAITSSVGVTAGVASLVPALGVAGALGLSPGRHGAGRLDRLNLSAGPSTSLAASLNPALPASKTTTPRRAAQRPHPRHGIVKPTLGNLAPHGPVQSRPGTAVGTRPTAPVATVSPPQTPPRAATPLPTPAPVESAAPPPSVPPVDAPAAPPAPTPVLPAAPVVTIPAVPAPSIPPVTLPTITTPSVALPSIPG